MFESLSERIGAALKKLSGRGVLRAGDVDAVLREVRLALLEADVNFKVVREFVERIRARLVGAEALPALTAAQQVVKVVHEELAQLLGGNQEGIRRASPPPAVLMLVGLQGAGKTTTAVKLALLGRREGLKPLVAALDQRRPAAAEQLRILAGREKVAFFEAPGAAEEVAAGAVTEARRQALDLVVLDTAGRLHADAELMAELGRMKQAVPAAQVLLAGTGERPTDLEVFHADRMASRILGMGDVLSLVEKAERSLDQDAAREVERHLRAGRLSFDDFLVQIRQLRTLGPVAGVLEMLPGAGRLKAQAGDSDPEAEVGRMEAIIQSMTAAERARPELIDGSRRRRIARGSGTQVPDVNRLLKAREAMQTLVKEMGRPGGKGLPKLFRGGTRVW